MMLIQTVLSSIKMIPILFLLFPSLVFSVEYYVDGINGSDANDGSDAAPWKTIGHALDPPGRWSGAGPNTLFVLSAIYNECILLNPVPLRSLNIIGISRDGVMPVIDATGVEDGNHAIQVKDYSGTIQGLEIKAAVKNGIDIAGDSLEAKVLNCTIHNNTKGIHVNNNSTPLLLDNIIYENSDCGIGNMGDSSATISGNRIYENGHGDLIGPSAGICVPKNSSPKIVNNIIRNNDPSGINIVDTAQPVISNNIIAHHRRDDSKATGIKVVHNEGINVVTVSNNIIYDNDHALFSQVGIEVSGSDFNSFWQNSEDYFGFTAGSADIFTDPLLDVNYNVAGESPCIDSGTSSNAPATDINGTLRPSGTGFDRGIYEYQESNSGVTCLSSILHLLLF